MFTLSKFPLYRQYDAMQCGVACLRMVCAHFGRQFSMEELSELCPTTSEGVSMLGISRAAEELGLHTACGRLTVDVLATAPLPCILHWNQNHFVVLHRISGRKGRRTFHVADPAKGRMAYGEDEFAEGWVSTRSKGEDKGIALLLEKNPRVRIVATAVTLESVAELTECVKAFPFREMEAVSLTAARSRKAGAYHLMTGQNPVYIFTMQG